MAKVKAKDFVNAAISHLGASYKEMDCQAFVERALADNGVKKDLTGSNAWYRDVRHCLPIELIVTEFGTVPEGAVLFIWANDNGEPEKYKADGLGNASHMGICTGKSKYSQDEGAIHSSSSKGKVCYSRFANKPINGGWNYAGFANEVDYGEDIEAILAEEGKDENVMTNAVVVAANGKPVNMRSYADKNSRAICQVPVGTEVLVLNGAGSQWYAIEYKGKTGFMMREFIELVDDSDDEPVEPEKTEEPAGSLEEQVADLQRRMKRLEREWEDKMGWG